MRNQLLTGFVLHQKPHGESRSLIYFFSQELGVMHGIGKKNLPLFAPIQIFATGKHELKTFSQSQVTANFVNLTGQALFAGMYLNEILVKLLPNEEPLPELWQAYQSTLSNIAQLFRTDSSNNLLLLKWHLRRFETLLFEQLGYGLDFTTDALGQLIDLAKSYRYQLQEGFIPLLPPDKADVMLTGEQLEQWQHCLQENTYFDKISTVNADNTKILLNVISVIYRTILDDLLNYQTLQSRELWRQLTQFS